MNGELCSHGRVAGHVCLDCPMGTAVAYVDPYDTVVESVRVIDLDKEVVNVERKPSGLDAAYYDLPQNIHSAQDLIEYLGLNFANGNILKSLVRQHGSTTKETDELYETEKRYYFAKRELERVRRNNEVERRGKRVRRELEESLRETVSSEQTGPDGQQGVSR